MNELMNGNDPDSPPIEHNDGVGVISNKALNCFNDSVNQSIKAKLLIKPLNQDFTKLMGKEDVVNLSTAQLSPSERLVLSYGLNFCPIPGKPDRGKF